MVCVHFYFASFVFFFFSPTRSSFFTFLDRLFHRHRRRHRKDGLPGHGFFSKQTHDAIVFFVAGYM